MKSVEGGLGGSSDVDDVGRTAGLSVDIPLTPEGDDTKIVEFVATGVEGVVLPWELHPLGSPCDHGWVGLNGR